jgi:2Fe-2S ferredoxin
MAKVTYIEFGGRERVVDVPTGKSVMEGATHNGVSGILADCGGACSCATCHVYVDAAWMSKVPPKDEVEESMLECVVELQPGSRLSCQIKMSDDLDGLVVRLPEKQV